MQYDLELLGKNIKQIREKKGITVKQLAKEIGKSVIWIEDVESGETLPGLKMLVYIASSLKVKVRDLIPF